MTQTQNKMIRYARRDAYRSKNLLNAAFQFPTCKSAVAREVTYCIQTYIGVFGDTTPTAVY